MAEGVEERSSSSSLQPNGMRQEEEDAYDFILAMVVATWWKRFLAQAKAESLKRSARFRAHEIVKWGPKAAGGGHCRDAAPAVTLEFIGDDRRAETVWKYSGIQNDIRR